MPQPDNPRRFNKRRLVVLIVVALLIVFSFFVGQHFGHTTYVLPQDHGAAGQAGSDRVGVPPDSLPQ